MARKTRKKRKTIKGKALARLKRAVFLRNLVGPKEAKEVRRALDSAKHAGASTAEINRAAYAGGARGSGKGGRFRDQ